MIDSIKDVLDVFDVADALSTATDIDDLNNLNDLADMCDASHCAVGSMDADDLVDLSDASGMVDLSDTPDLSELDGGLDGDSDNSEISFQASATPSFDTGKDVHIVCESGNDKGYFDVYLHDGKKYIKFGSGSRSQWSNWVKLPSGTNRFSWNGNWYIIK